MKTFINAWAGEGSLSVTALFLLACMDMFQDFPEIDEKICIRVLELQEAVEDERLHSLVDAYQHYYQTVYEKPANLVLDGISLNTLVDYHTEANHSIRKKLKPSDYLFLGCSEQELDLCMTESIYGQPSLGEIFYENTELARLYETIPARNTKVMIINCGSYCGDGTAAVFMPKEAKYHPGHGVVRRYHVISGPATTYTEQVAIPHPNIYQQPIHPVSIFYVPRLISQLSSITCRAEDYPLHEKNIAFLHQAYQKIVSPKHDYRTLSPDYMMECFIERLHADNSAVCASFVNYSTDGNGWKLDEFQEGFVTETNKQLWHLHRIHVINALSIREILGRSQQYRGGRVYSFANPTGGYFQPSTIFEEQCEKKFWRFLLMTLMVRHVVSFYSTYQHIIQRKKEDARTPKTDMLKGIRKSYHIQEADATFTEQVKQHLSDLLENYMQPVVRMCYEIQKCSWKTCFFPGDTEQIVKYLLCQGTLQMQMFISGILHQLSKYDNDVQVQEKAVVFLRAFEESFPDDSDLLNAANGAEQYSKKIVRHIRVQAEHLIL